MVNVLNKRREPGKKRKCLASIAVRDNSTSNVSSVFLVEAQVDPAHKPSELDDDPWALETNDAHNSGEC